MTLTPAITLGEVVRRYHYEFACPSDTLPELSDILATPVEARVAKGVAWLEEQGAYDWPEKILAAGVKFRMANCARCAVGVTLGDYIEFTRRTNLLDASPVVRHNEGLRHGFSAVTMEGYDELEEAWIERAQTEMKWRAS